MPRVNTDEIEFTNDYRYLWKGVPFSGVGFELSNDGCLLSEMEFREGIQNGLTIQFFRSGKTERECHYENNTLNGIAREWNEDGLLLLEEEYERGICVRRKTWDQTGKLISSFELDEADPQFELLKLIRQAKFVAPPD